MYMQETAQKYDFGWTMECCGQTMHAAIHATNIRHAQEPGVCWYNCKLNNILPCN